VTPKKEPIEPEVSATWLEDEGLIFIHQGKTAIVITKEQAWRVMDSLMDIVGVRP
jgi:hypothetical protein